MFKMSSATLNIFKTKSSIVKLENVDKSVKLDMRPQNFAKCKKTRWMYCCPFSSYSVGFFFVLLLLSFTVRRFAYFHLLCWCTFDEQLSITKFTENYYKYQQIDEKQTEMEIVCSVCSDKYIDGCSVTSLNCGHVFHTDCLDEWFDK